MYWVFYATENSKNTQHGFSNKKLGGRDTSLLVTVPLHPTLYEDNMTCKILPILFTLGNPVNMNFLSATFRCQNTCMQLHEDSSRNLRGEMVAQWQTEKVALEEVHQKRLTQLKWELYLKLYVEAFLKT